MKVFLYIHLLCLGLLSGVLVAELGKPTAREQTFLKEL
jgi:hypothetical protein